MNGTHGSGEPDGGGQDDVAETIGLSCPGVNLTSGFYKVSSGTPQLITLQDGEYVVQAAIQDAAGNTTTVQKSIVVDTQPPHLESLTVAPSSVIAFDRDIIVTAVFDEQLAQRPNICFKSEEVNGSESCLSVSVDSNESFFITIPASRFLRPPLLGNIKRV